MITKQRNRAFVFAKGAGWYDLYSGKYYEGGQKIIADAPYERMPVFVKEVLLFLLALNCNTQLKSRLIPLHLYVYTGKDASFTLYEDEGTNYNYEKGAFAQILFTYDQETGTLTIGERQGSFNGMLKKRTFHIKVINKEKPSGMKFDVPADKTITYSGKTVKVRL